MATLLRTSCQKLDLVAQPDPRPRCGTCRHRADVHRASGIAHDVKKTLESAIANAENNHNLDVDRLFVAEASVGKRMVMKRFHARARGRAGGSRSMFSQLRIVVRERVDAVEPETEREAA